MSEIVVQIADQVEVSDVVTRTPSRIDILIQDVIAISDRVILPRMTAIDSIEPARVRAGDSVVISGQGFATSIANNRVTFNGFVATITAAAEDSLTVTVPALVAFTENGYATVEVETPPLSLVKGRARAWVKWSTIEEEADETLPIQTADRREVLSSDSPQIAEAEDYNRLLTLVEHSQLGGAEGSAGGFKSRDTVGLVGVPRRNEPDNISEGGESLVVDPAQPGLVALGWQLDDILGYGGTFAAAASGNAFLRANGTPDGVLNLVETEQVAMLDGVVDLIWFLVKAGTDVINLTNLFVNGGSVFSDGTSIGNDAVASFKPNWPVSKGDRIELRVTKLGTNAIMRIVGGIRVRYS